MKKAFLFIFLLLGVFVYAQEKYALVIGNGEYTGISRLHNPVNDANDMARTLQDLGFTVEKITNGNLDEMENAAMNLKRRLGASRDAYGFFFYAGHGVQSGGDNYLIPVDASSILSENHLRQRAFSVQTLLDNLNEARNELNIIVLDACRDNPFGWSRSSGRGLALLNSAPAGSIIMYATSANSAAEDGVGRNGLFTGQLLNNLGTPGMSVRDIFDKTGEDVLRVSNGRQHPELSIKFFGASSAYLGSSPAQGRSLSVFPPDLTGAWLHDDTTIVFSPDSFSISWPDSKGNTVGYTVSLLSCTAAENTSGNNPRYQYGYRITGKINSSTVSSVIAGDLIDRSYFFDINKRSFWNSESSVNVIYRRQQ